MELGLSPAQVDEIEPDMLWRMLHHAKRVHLERTALMMVAYHDPKRFQEILNDFAVEDAQAHGINKADQDAMRLLQAEMQRLGHS